MIKRLLAASVLTALVLGVFPAGAAIALPRGLRVKTYEGGLNFPVDMATVPGTRKVFFTQKSGKIGVIKRGRVLRSPCARLDVNSRGERGLLGIALRPRFRENRHLYVFLVHDSPLESRVSRFKVEGNRCRNGKQIVKNIPVTDDYHIGGQIEFVRGKLFVSVGDGHTAANAQNKHNRLGKILRYNPGGSIPKSNPFNRSGDRSPVWTYGHRNGFGLTQKPGSRKLYESENGPECDDEINRIRKGRNYGWGSGYDCGTRGVGRRPKRPLRRYSTPIAVTDPWYYRGKLGRLSGDMYVGGFRDGTLHRLVMNRKGTDIRRDRVLLRRNEGIVDVSKDPGGGLYFMTPSAIFKIVRRG